MQVSLASDFMYNYMSRDVTASVGYDYILRQVISVANKLLECLLQSFALASCSLLSIYLSSGFDECIALLVCCNYLS